MIRDFFRVMDPSANSGLATMSYIRSLLHRLAAHAALLRRDRRGSIAVFIAAAAIPLIGALGLATDTARGYLVKSRLHQALDAAALAGGQDMAGPTRDADIQKFFTANFPTGYMDATVAPLSISTDVNKTTLTVTATATVPTTFMRLLGFNEITVAAQTEVKKNLWPALDVVLSIDLSQSMSQPMSKIQAARQAASDLMNELFGYAATSPQATIGGVTYNLLNVGLVPWNQVVNITERGKPTFSTYYTTDEIVPPYKNPLTGQTNRTHRYRPNSSPSVPLFSAPTSSWRGCVYARYDNDTNYSNDADLTLGLGMSLGIPGGSSTKNWVAFEANYSSECLSYPITPLQPSNTVIQSAIAQLTTPKGKTNIVQGLYWAWEVLMPGEPFDHALASVPYPRNRAIVLLTDGQQYGSTDDAYGGAFGTGTTAGTTTSKGKLPSPPAAANTYNNLNNRLKLLAEFIKAQGILIYVVQFDENSATLTSLLQSVATQPNKPYYFKAPTAAELKAAFQMIAGELVALRISK